MAMIMNDWLPAIQGEFKKPYYRELFQFVKEEYSRAVIYPPADDIFNAMHFTPLSEVKVLILGQDPYHNENQAHGLSFSVLPSQKEIPPSLQNIYKELQDDLGAEDDERHRDEQPEDDQERLMGLMSLLGGARNGDHVVEAHHEVRDDDGLDGADELAAALDLFMIAVLGKQELGADPDEKRTARHLEEREVEKHHRAGDQHDAQGDGAGRAPEDALVALALRQVAARHGDHDGIVAAEKNVDHDDLADRSPMQVGKQIEEIFQNSLRGKISKTGSR